jgi:hypothetical protein
MLGPDNGSGVPMMDEHDDDLEPEVEDGVEFEVEDFQILTEEDEETEGGDEHETPVMERDIDPDKSEI